MNISLLNLLRCPFCGGKFSASGSDHVSSELGYNILICHCSRYPVVAGIPVLKKDGITVKVIALIETRQYLEALLTLITPSNLFSMLPFWIRSLPKLRSLAYQRALRNWQERASILLMNKMGQVTAHELFKFYFHDKEACNYFSFRFGQPRHLVALSFTSLIHQPKKPILDLSCGCGHITRSLVHRAKAQQVIGIDTFFFGLYVAKHWIAPEAEYVCCSSDTSLPFPNGSFSVAFCSDAFHYFVNKALCIRELKHLIQAEGVIMLVWVHNALHRRPHDGLPLPPEGYQDLVDDMPHCLVADSNVLARYLQKTGPPLARSVDIRRLSQEPLLSVIASHRQEVFQDYGLFSDWPHAKGHLGLNPLFVKEREDRHGKCTLSLKFPSAFYEEDHSECKDYLPGKIEIHSKILDDLAYGERTLEIERLIEKCVVLDIPMQFCRYSFPTTK